MMFTYKISDRVLSPTLSTDHLNFEIFQIFEISLFFARCVGIKRKYDHSIENLMDFNMEKEFLRFNRFSQRLCKNTDFKRGEISENRDLKKNFGAMVQLIFFMELGIYQGCFV